MNAIEFIENNNLLSDEVFKWSCEKCDADNMMHVLRAYGAKTVSFMAASHLVNTGRKLMNLEKA